MVTPNYDTQPVIEAFLDYAHRSHAEVTNNTFARKPLPNESVASITAVLDGVTKKSEDAPYISIYFQQAELAVDIVGFNFDDADVSKQLDLCKIVFNSTLAYRRYQKKRLNPFKPNYIYELTITHDKNSLVLERWDSELKLGLKTDDALQQLTA